MQEYASEFKNLIGQTIDMGEQDQIAYFIDGLKHATKMEISYRVPEIKMAPQLILNFKKSCNPIAT